MYFSLGQKGVTVKRHVELCETLANENKGMDLNFYHNDDFYTGIKGIVVIEEHVVVFLIEYHYPDTSTSTGSVCSDMCLSFSTTSVDCLIVDYPRGLLPYAKQITPVLDLTNGMGLEREGAI